MIMRKIVVLFCLLSLHPAIQSQDIHFSQFYQAPLNQNPALAGAERKSEASLQYRSQWQSVADPYTTMAANVYTRLGKSNRENFFGLGANFFQDQSGDSKLRTTLAALSLAYHVRIGNNHKLGLGVSAAYGQLSVDSKALEWGSQYSGNAYNPSIDPGEVLGQAAFAYPDLSNGFVVKKNVFSGKAFAFCKINSAKKVISVMPNSIGIQTKEGNATVSEYTKDLGASKIKIKEIKKKGGDGVVLTDADIVISAGRGLKGPENWGMIEGLAKEMGAATACSRPVADIGWRPHHEHVGQTGVTVRPNLYIAIGQQYV